MSPQGTFLIPLLVSVRWNPTQFKDQDCFSPINFLDKGYSRATPSCPLPQIWARQGGGQPGQALCPQENELPECRSGPMGDRPLFTTTL